MGLMGQVSNKQREIRQRHERVLESARKLLLRGGYHKLTMARVAKETGCSKATVYQHFPCKEELILALATRSVDKQYALVERAARFPGRPRERMVAVGESTHLFARLYSEDTRLFQIVTGEAVLQKVSEAPIQALRRAGMRTVEVMMGIGRDAIAQGDLVLRPGHTLPEIIYHMWLLGESGKAAQATWLPPLEMGVQRPFETILKTAQIFGDGYGWRPLSTEWDYAATIARVRREVFPAETRKAYGPGALAGPEKGMKEGFVADAEKGGEQRRSA